MDIADIFEKWNEQELEQFNRTLTKHFEAMRDMSFDEVMGSIVYSHLRLIGRKAQARNSEPKERKVDE